MEDLTAVVSEVVADMGDVATVDPMPGDDAPLADDSAPVVDAADPGLTPAADPEDPFAQEHGLVAKRPDGRQNRIPFDRVKAISENAVRKRFAPIAEALGFPKDKFELDKVLSTFNERNTKYSEFEAIVQQAQAVDRLMSDPDAFIREAAKHNPGYQRYADLLNQAAAGDPGAQAAVANIDAQNDPEPEPDIPLTDDNGNVTGYTYSIERLKEARAWDRRQAAREAEAKLGKRIEPFEKERQEREKTEQQAARAREIATMADKAVGELLGRAEKWPMFKENGQAIIDAVTKDPNLDIRDAYIQHVMPMMHADYNKMRAKILKELQGAPAATSAASAAVVPVKDDANMSLEDTVRQAMRNARLV